ncbi:MAG: hypothetical protein LAP38_12640 [Acidobacteriia bacterium]|nr:hypothetical protein [Terriglobia bacterium]
MTKANLLVAAALLLPGLACSQMAIATGELPLAAKGMHYSATITVRVDGRCDHGDVSLSLENGALPKGVELTASGVEGVAREMGRFRFSVRAWNACASATRAFELIVTGKPILEATPDEVTFSCRTPAQAPAPKTILVSSTWPNRPYTVTTRNAEWLRVEQDQGVTPDSDSAITGDVVTLTVDPSKLEPGTYRGSVVFWTRDGVAAPTVPVVLVVGSQK